MGLLTRTPKLTKEQKRHAVFLGRYNAATSPAEQLRIATDYIRTACRDMDDSDLEAVARDVFQFATQAAGVNSQ